MCDPVSKRRLGLVPVAEARDGPVTATSVAQLPGNRDKYALYAHDLPHTDCYCCARTAGPTELTKNTKNGRNETGTTEARRTPYSADTALLMLLCEVACYEARELRSAEQRATASAAKAGRRTAAAGTTTTRRL